MWSPRDQTLKIMFIKCFYSFWTHQEKLFVAINPIITSKESLHEIHIAFIGRDFRRQCNASLARAGSTLFKLLCSSLFWRHSYLYKLSQFALAWNAWLFVVKRLGKAVFALRNSVVLHKENFLNTLTILPNAVLQSTCLKVYVQHILALVLKKLAWIFFLVSVKIISSSGVLNGEEEEIRTYYLLHFLFLPGPQFREEKTAQTMFQPKLVA